MASDQNLEKALEDIENLKKEMAALKTDGLVDTALLMQQIIDLGRQLAIVRLVSQASNVLGVIDNQLHRNPSIKSQVLNDVARFKERIYNSEDPEEIVTRFVAEWSGKLARLNCRFVAY